MPKKKCHDVDGAYFGCSFANILLVVKNITNSRYIPIWLQDPYKHNLSQKYTASKYMERKVQNIKKKNRKKD